MPLTAVAREAAVSLYLNPATDHIDIEMYTGVNTPVRLYLTNASGIIVRTVSKDLLQGISKSSFSLKELPVGIYYLHIQTGEK